MFRSTGCNLALLILIVFSALNLSSCSEDCDVCPQPPTTEDIELPSAEYGPFCITHHMAGDGDFDGNGPEVTLVLDFSVSGDSLLFHFFVEARETQSDWTEGRGWGDGLLYQAPEGWTISAVDTPLAVIAEYQDSNTEMDFIDFGDVKFRGYGDGDGDDVGSNCVCTSFSCTRYWVWLRDIHVEITKE